MGTMSINEFSQLTGISKCALREWDRKKILVPLKTPTGQRRYTLKMQDIALLAEVVAEPKTSE